MKSIVIIFLVCWSAVAWQVPSDGQRGTYRCRFSGTVLSCQDANVDSTEEIQIDIISTVTIDLLLTITAPGSGNAGNFHSFIIDSSENFPFEYSLNHPFSNSADTTDSIACMSYCAVPAAGDDSTGFLLHLRTVNRIVTYDDNHQKLSETTLSFTLSNRDSILPDYIVTDKPFAIRFMSWIKDYKKGTVMRSARSTRLLEADLTECTIVPDYNSVSYFRERTVPVGFKPAAAVVDLLGRTSKGPLPCIYIIGQGQHYRCAARLNGTSGSKSAGKASGKAD